MSEAHDYPIEVRWMEGRRFVASAPGVPPLVVKPPPQFGGPGESWSPEHLFVASVASCLMSTFLAIAGFSRLEVIAAAVEAEGRLEKGEDRRFSFTRVTVRPRITIADEGDRERALKLLHKAEGACLVSRSLRAEVVLEPHVELAVPAAMA